MSMDKLAKLLNVDEVMIEHGHKGFALSVRLGEDWMGTTVDHDELNKAVHGRVKPKMHGVAEKLVTITDTLLHGVSRAVIAKQVPLPVRPVVPQQEYDIRGRQLQRYAPTPTAYEAPATPAPEPASTVNMASRFHAIVAELNKL